MARRDDLAVVAISYDPVDVLSRFTEEFGISYPLLSDEGSVVIERLGMLNHVIEEEQVAWGRQPGPRHRRLPFPGTFLLDEEGRVIDRKFERSHRIRPSGSLLLRDLLPEEEPNPAVLARAGGPAVDAVAWLDEEAAFPGQRLVLHLRLQVDEGFHLYVPPVPDGYVPLEVSVGSPEEVVVEPIRLPGGASFTIDGLPEEFFVVEGAVDLSIPFALSDELTGDLALEVGIQYQACDERSCLPPARLTLELPIGYQPIPRP